jgi:hypothetical protein
MVAMDYLSWPVSSSYGHLRCHGEHHADQVEKRLATYAQSLCLTILGLEADQQLNISDDNVSVPLFRNLFVCNTRIGPFYIAESGGRFHPVYEDESLGSYARPEQAAEDVAGGHTFSISGGIDTATLGILEDLSE